MVELRHGIQEGCCSLSSSRLVQDERGFIQLPHSRVQHRYWSVSTSLDFSAPYLSLVQHPTPSVPSTPFSIVDPGMMVPVTGLWVNLGIVMSANDAMINTPLPTAPFEPTRRLSSPGPSLHPGKNAVGVNYKVALQVAAPLLCK